MNSYFWVFAISIEGVDALNLAHPDYLEGFLVAPNPPPVPKAAPLQADVVPQQAILTAIRAKDGDFASLYMFHSVPMSAEDAQTFVSQGRGRALFETSLNSMLFVLESP